MSKAIARVWIFASSSDPDKKHETLQYTDRSVSCGCPGWTRRVAPDGTRSCRHVRLVHMGIADTESDEMHIYEGFDPTPTTNNRKEQRHGKENKTDPPQQGPGFGEFGGRKIIK